MANPVTQVGNPNGPSSGGYSVVPPGGGYNPPTSTLPSIPTSGNGPTGVATSDLATNSIGAAQTNTNNLQNSVATHAATKTANAPGFDPTVSIIDLLTSKGMPSDYASRAKLAAQAGIQNYTGSAQQNAQLIGYVNTQDQAAANAPTTTTTNPTAAGGTATTTATTPSTATSQTTSTTSDPFVNTGAPGDVYNSALNDTFNQLGQTADQMKIQINSILNGTFPLTAMQQASMNSVTDALHQVTQQQIAAGKSAQGIAAINANRTGLATTDPVETANEQQQIMSDNLNKIQNLDDDASKTLGALQQSFMDSDMTGIMDKYSVLKDTLDAKTAAIEKAQDDVNSFSEFWDTYNQKASEFAATQVQAQNAALAKVGPALAQLAGSGLTATVKSGIGTVGFGALVGAKNKEIANAYGPNVSVANSPSTTNGDVYEGIVQQISTESGASIPATKLYIYQQYPQFASFDYQQAIQDPATETSMSKIASQNPDLIKAGNYPAIMALYYNSQATQ